MSKYRSIDDMIADCLRVYILQDEIRLLANELACNIIASDEAVNRLQRYANRIEKMTPKEVFERMEMYGK